jgi:transposase-like protein
MRRYSEAVKADVRRRMSPPHRQSVAQISAELGIHIVTLYNWMKGWRLQGEVVLEDAGLNATELSAYCRERGLCPEQVERWRQAAPTWPVASVPEALDANEKLVLTL